MIRKMYESDRGRILSILQATNMFTSAELTLATEQIDIYLDGMNQSKYSIVVIENDDFEVVGYMSYGLAPLTDGAYNIHSIAISPKSQRHGYGKELVSWLDKHVKESDRRMILIDTSSQQKYKPTREFFRALGFKEVSRIPDYYKHGNDRITYIKSIKKKK